jgi:CRISPR/Cas system-associated exonuclease Cas4 (RecB family)
MIFDGKGTDTIGKNISNDQLLFYALLYYFHHKTLPSEIGFFYYRFNSMVKIPFDLNVLNEFRARLSLDIKSMLNDENHKATPNYKACRYCNYRNGCVDHIMYKGQHSRKSKVEGPEGDGVQEFSM